MNALTKTFSTIVLSLVSIVALSQPIDLLDAYQLALENDSDIHVAYNQLLSSKEVSPQALADLLPSIEAAASTNDVRQESKSSFSGPGKVTNRFSDEGYSVSVRQTLFNWADFTRYNQAGKRVSKAETEYQLAEQALILRLTERYLDALQADANLGLANDNVSAFTRQLEHAKNRFDVGLIAITDVHNAQARYDLSLATQIAAQDNVYSAEEALREIIQKDDLRLAPLAQQFPLSPPEPNNIGQWELTSSENNLAIKMARYDVDIAKKEIEFNRSGHYPTVDIVASHAYRDTGSGSFGTGFTNETDNIGLELNMPLFSGGKTQSLTKQAAFDHRKSVDTLQSLQRTTLRQTRDSFRGVTASMLRIKAHYFEPKLIRCKRSRLGSGNAYDS